LRHLAGRIGDFAALAERIRGVIDERGEVRDDASPKLARIRREIENAGRDIGETVKRLLRDPDLRRLLQFPNPTFHNDRVVLPVRTEYRGRIQGIIHRTSDSGATIYVEPAQAVELNNQISNLRAEEQEEINRLLWDLAHQAHLNAAEILKTIDAIAVLDLIAAKVRFAHDFELRCPQISSEPVLSVRQARHPLLTALCRRRRAAGDADVAEVVPISYRLGEDFDLLVITGPNTGGKTVTLKTIGLLHLMVQAGMPVPVADGSTFGIFNNVLIDVGDEQNMQQSLSTFSAHLHRLMDMLRRAGRQTLVLMDELGAGTDPDEGAAIGRAISTSPAPADALRGHHAPGRPQGLRADAHPRRERLGRVRPANAATHLPPAHRRVRVQQRHRGGPASRPAQAPGGGRPPQSVPQGPRSAGRLARHG
jgi:DNA mismatch repair protein MutS2